MTDLFSINSFSIIHFQKAGREKLITVSASSSTYIKNIAIHFTEFIILTFKWLEISPQNDTYKYKVTIINGIGHVFQEISIREIKLYFTSNLGR